MPERLIRWDVIAADGTLLGIMWAPAEHPPVVVGYRHEEVVAGVVRYGMGLATIERPQWDLAHIVC